MSISQRIHDDVLNVEHLVWRALKESGPAALDYLDDECAFLMFDGTILGHKSKPSLKKYLKSSDFKPWLTYEMSDVQVVEVDLMAAVIYYRAVVSRIEVPGKKPQTYNLIVSSTWKQIASADWKMVSHQQTLA
jgi:hypothetical protein